MVLTCRIWLALAVTAWVAAMPAEAARPGTHYRDLEMIEDSGAAGLAVGPGGRIVMAGSTYSYIGGYQHWVRAYLPDGRPDLSFDSDGVKELEEPQRTPADVVIQPDGRIVVALTGWNGLLRLNPDGSPDASFGEGGLQDLGIGRQVSDLALQPDGKLVVVTVGSGSVSVTRHRADGSPDPGFGASLSPVPETAGARVAIQEPGGGFVITATGTEVGKISVGRLEADGRLDDSFGAGGFAPVQLGQSDWTDKTRFSFAPAPMLTRDGRIRAPASFRESADVRYRTALVGLTASGHPDLDFGHRGLAVAPRRVTRGGSSAQMAIGDASGSIVVVGFAARRFRADGAFDRSFASAYLPQGQLGGLAFLDTNTLIGAVSVYGYHAERGSASLWALYAGHDLRAPSLSVLVRGCRSIRVGARDAIGLDKVVVRADGRVVRRTHRRRLGLRLPRGVRRVLVVATDLAGNASRERVRLPRC